MGASSSSDRQEAVDAYVDRLMEEKRTSPNLAADAIGRYGYRGQWDAEQQYRQLLRAYGRTDVLPSLTIDLQRGSFDDHVSAYRHLLGCVLESVPKNGWLVLGVTWIEGDGGHTSLLSLDTRTRTQAFYDPLGVDPLPGAEPITTYDLLGKTPMVPGWQCRTNMFAARSEDSVAHCLLVAAVMYRFDCVDPHEVAMLLDRSMQRREIVENPVGPTNWQVALSGRAAWVKTIGDVRMYVLALARGIRSSMCSVFDDAGDICGRPPSGRSPWCFEHERRVVPDTWVLWDNALLRAHADEESLQPLPSPVLPIALQNLFPGRRVIVTMYGDVRPERCSGTHGLLQRFTPGSARGDTVWIAHCVKVRDLRSVLDALYEAFRRLGARTYPSAVLCLDALPVGVPDLAAFAADMLQNLPLDSVTQQVWPSLRVMVESHGVAVWNDIHLPPPCFLSPTPPTVVRIDMRGHADAVLRRSQFLELLRVLGSVAGKRVMTVQIAIPVQHIAEPGNISAADLLPRSATVLTDGIGPQSQTLAALVCPHILDSGDLAPRQWQVCLTAINERGRQHVLTYRRRHQPPTFIQVEWSPSATFVQIPDGLLPQNGSSVQPPWEGRASEPHNPMGYAWTPPRIVACDEHINRIIDQLPKDNGPTGAAPCARAYLELPGSAVDDLVGCIPHSEHRCAETPENCPALSALCLDRNATPQDVHVRYNELREHLQPVDRTAKHDSAFAWVNSMKHVVQFPDPPSCADVVANTVTQLPRSNDRSHAEACADAYLRMTTEATEKLVQCQSDVQAQCAERPDECPAKAALCLQDTATPQDIRARYHGLSLKVHPDKMPIVDDPHRQEELKRKHDALSKWVNEMKNVLQS